jgi:hypothetical protein
MKKRTLKLILPLIALTGGLLALTGRAPSSRAQSAPAPTCTGVNTTTPSFTLEYSVTSGATLTGTNLSNPGTNSMTAKLLKVIEGKPNPDFDRLYALLMKGIDGPSFSAICVQGDTPGATTGTLVSLSLRSH